MERIEVTIDGKKEYIEINPPNFGSSEDWGEYIKKLGGESRSITIDSEDFLNLDEDVFEDDMEFYLKRNNKLYFRKGKNRLVLSYEATPETEAQIKDWKYHQIVHVTGRFEYNIIPT